MKNEKEIVLIFVNFVVNYDEIGEIEKVIEFMEKVREIFERLNEEKNYFISFFDLVYFKYELGEYDEVEVLIKEVFRNFRDDEIEINVKFIEVEIWVGRGDYDKVFKVLCEVFVKVIDVSDDIFGIVFDILIDFISGFFEEGFYEVVVKNMEVFVEFFEDDIVYFFRVIGEFVRWKVGDDEVKKCFDEFYEKVENEELKEIFDEWKKFKLVFGLSF